ncbi:TFB2 [Enterospora canceri]|uniref:General transcription and DNA repair factor IIH subunit TFB2 n=1 Tax=Enterospora canceri TaxID=1081671 RepID=A0A1Y1S6Q8_9MICR|nr:TFB2 [Enterospora canceri]
MIKGVLDEQKVANALDRQIEAEQLIKYLERHTVKSNNENVINQIRIWRNKRNRISRETGYLYDEFDNYNEYRNYIEKAGTDGIIYKNDEERMIFSRRRIV